MCVDEGCVMGFGGLLVWVLRVVFFWRAAWVLEESGLYV